jgi:hypothetical protein
MASDVMSLFNMPTQEQLGQDYLRGMMVSPQQLGQQSLLQQVVSMGGNAGAGIGYGLGRLMGGMTADEVRAKGINDAMQTVQGMGLTSDADMYGALSQELAKRGLTQDALMARNTGLKALQAEEQMRLARQQGDINLSELGIKQEAAAREAELLPLKIKGLQLDITTKEEALKTTEEQLAEALKAGDTPRAQGLQRRLDAQKEEINLKKRELDIRSRQAEASMVTAEAAKSRADALANQESYSQNVTVRDMLGQPVSIGRYSTKLNEFMANDGTKFKTRAELEAYAKEQSVPVNPAPNKGKTPQKPISSFGG